MSAELATLPESLPVTAFTPRDAFDLAAREAKVYATSTLVPQIYRDNPANCLIALNMAKRLGADILMTMQNLYVVNGNPGWSSKFLIACVNQCGRFTAMRFEFRGEEGTKDRACRAFAIEKMTKDRLDGTWVTWKMVDAEGWAAKNGSKWKTMPEQMFVYRAAAFWTRAYAPELTMGLQTVEELHDIIDVSPMAGSSATIDNLNSAITGTPPATTLAEAIEGTDAASNGGEKEEASIEPLAFAYVMNEINEAADIAACDVVAPLILRVEDERQRAELDVELRTKRKALTK